VAFVAVVDDDVGVLESIVDLLRSLGHRAEPFDSARALLCTPVLHRFDCVISDVRLRFGDIGGVALATRIGRTVAGLPVILISATADGPVPAAARPPVVAIVEKARLGECLPSILHVALGARMNRF
jgi:FixJ family two-component response regulator